MKRYSDLSQGIKLIDFDTVMVCWVFPGVPVYFAGLFFILKAVGEVLKVYNDNMGTYAQDGMGDSFEVIEGLDNVRGRVGVSDSVHFLGLFEQSDSCR